MAVALLHVLVANVLRPVRTLAVLLLPRLITEQIRRPKRCDKMWKV
jgi:hypothetical protein